MRNLNKSDNVKLSATKESLPIRVKQLDLTDDMSVKNTMQSIFSETGRIDVLVNNAAYPLTGAFEDLAMDEIKAQYETNVFGLIRTTQAVLSIMIEGLSQSTAYELEQFGIKVIIIEPGVIGTNFANNVVVAKKSRDPNSPYSQMTQKMASAFEKMLKNASSPELVAKVVLEAITNETPNLRYLAGKDAETLLAARRSMSDEEFYKTKQNLN